MKDVRDEIIHALGGEEGKFTTANNIPVYVSSRELPLEPHVEDDSWLVFHLKREFPSFNFESIVNYLRTEINDNLMNILNSGTDIDKIAILFKEVPALNNKKAISYTVVFRKK